MEEIEMPATLSCTISNITTIPNKIKPLEFLIVALIAASFAIWGLYAFRIWSLAQPERIAIIVFLVSLFLWKVWSFYKRKKREIAPTAPEKTSWFLCILSRNYCMSRFSATQYQLIDESYESEVLHITIG